jgi:hypothetical protein
LQAVGVELRRQAEVVAGAGEHFPAQEIVVGGELLLELRVGLLVPRDAVFLEQLLDAGDHRLVVGEVALDPVLERAAQLGVLQLLARVVLGQPGQRRGAGRHAGVLAQAHQGRRAPRRLHLIVEQGAEAPEDRLGDVGVGEVVLASELASLLVVFDGLDQDL